MNFYIVKPDSRLQMFNFYRGKFLPKYCRFITDDRYRIKVFTEYNVEWLDFIAQSRKNCRPWEGYDWIEGGIADDRVISTVDAYIDGYMSASQAMDRLVNEQLRHQVCILNQEIIDNYMVFDHSETL